jgi:transposase
MHFVTIKTLKQMDLLFTASCALALGQPAAGVINQIRGFLIERGITVRQGGVPLRKLLPEILTLMCSR